MAVWELDRQIITAKCRNLFSIDKDLPELQADLSKFYTYNDEEDEKQNAVRISVNYSDIPMTVYDYTLEKPEFPGPKDGKIIPLDVLEGRATLADLIGQMTPKELCNVCVGDAWENGPK